MLLRWLARRHRDRLMRDALRSRFVVTLLDGQTFEGLLVEADERTLVLVQGAALGEKGVRQPVDGALYVERTRLAYLQRPEGLSAAALLPGTEA